MSEWAAFCCDESRDLVRGAVELLDEQGRLTMARSADALRRMSEVSDPGELTITQRVVTAMPDGTAINVRFTPPQGFNADTGTFVETGSRIGAFTASFVNESGVTEEIKSSDIKYYMYSDGGWVLLDNRPSAAGQYKVQISDNYSFRGTYSLSFVILSATG